MNVQECAGDILLFARRVNTADADEKTLIYTKNHRALKLLFPESGRQLIKVTLPFCCLKSSPESIWGKCHGVLHTTLV